MERKKLIRLVTAAQNGDHKAVDTLFNAYYNDVYYFALKTVKDEETACEVTQDTFVSILKNFKDLKEPAAFVTWMKQIAYNHCARFFQKKKDVLVDEDEEGNTVFDAVPEERTEFVPDEALDQEDFRKTIMGMLDELSPEQRSATMLYYYSEMSVKQIAQIQGVSEGTVKSRLNYARKAIKKSVEDYEKKNDVKLHSVTLLPLLFWLFAGAEEEMPVGAVPIIIDGVAAETGVGLTVGGTSAYGGAALLEKLMGLPIIIKVTAVVAAVALVIACVSIAIPKETPSVEPTVSLQMEQTVSTDNITEPTVTEPVMTEPVMTESVVMEPSVSEPPVTEPPVTDPPVTEPPVTDPPVTSRPETKPPVTEPPITEPPVTEPEATVFYVPEGCTYVMNDGTELLSGDAMPENCTDGDKFITDAYTYVYGREYGEGEFFDDDGNFLGVGVGFVHTGIDGWSVVVKDKSQTSYPDLQDEVNGEPLVSLQNAFNSCKNMTQAPVIPSSVTNLAETFSDCYSLAVTPAIPEGVTRMFSTFSGCAALKTVPVLPNTVTSLSCTFAGCTSLKSAPKIPSSVLYMDHAFMGCTSMTRAPELPDGIRDLCATFQGSGLQIAPEIPARVTNLGYAFAGTAITTAPRIPVGVTNMNNTFANCTFLTEAPVIPETVTEMYCTFSGCTSLITAPEIPSGVTSIRETFQNCTAMTTVPTIPETVTDMYSTFSGCTALTGNIEINATLSDGLLYCFEGTIKPIVLTGSCDKLEELAATAENGNVTVE